MGEAPASELVQKGGELKDMALVPVRLQPLPTYCHDEPIVAPASVQDVLASYQSEHPEHTLLPWQHNP